MNNVHMEKPVLEKFEVAVDNLSRRCWPADKDGVAVKEVIVAMVLNEKDQWGLETFEDDDEYLDCPNSTGCSRMIVLSLDEAACKKRRGEVAYAMWNDAVNTWINDLGEDGVTIVYDKTDDNQYIFEDDIRINATWQDNKFGDRALFYIGAGFELELVKESEKTSRFTVHYASDKSDVLYSGRITHK